MTRCCAPVTESYRWQPWKRHVDRRCHRTAHLLAGGKPFCFQHFPSWRAHYAIVERIRSFPDKVI